MEATPQSIRDLLHTYIRSSLAFIAEHRIEIRVLGEIFMNLCRPTAELVYGLTDEEPLLATLEEGFRAGQATGEFRPFDTQVMVLTLRATIDKYSVQSSATSDIDLDIYIRELIELFDRATLVPRSERPLVSTHHQRGCCLPRNEREKEHSWLLHQRTRMAALRSRMGASPCRPSNSSVSTGSLGILLRWITSI
jgi:hypothetical protein